MPEIKPDIETFAKIKVLGIGGGGGAALNRMVESNIKGVEFIAVNTDVQALYHSKAPIKLHIGKNVTRGLGAGMNPDLGKQAAEESQDEIRELIKGADMLFITCGCGGGTGSGAAPYIANLAREMGILTVGVVTKPFSFEGVQRMSIAMKCIENLEERLDTLITIPNDKMLQLVDKKTSLVDAFKITDDVLRQGIQGISELITVPGLINVDFADVKSIMKNTGSALMGVGVGSGENRAIEAAKSAIESPLLELSIDGAKGVLFTIAGGPNLSMHEVSEAAGIITSSVDSNARIIFGAVIDENISDEIRITVIATDFEHLSKNKQKNSADILSSRSQSYTPPQNRPFSVLLGAKTTEENISQEVQNIQNHESNFIKKQPLNYNEPIKDTQSLNIVEEDNNQKNSNLNPIQNFKQSKAQAQQNLSKNQEPINLEDDDEEDLEIPAFIRRQMQ